MKDSQEWGNYSNVSFEYTTTSGGTSTKNANSSSRLPTGCTERNKSNNIYDLAGNVLEWTMEGNGSYSRRVRGGYCYYAGSGWPAGEYNSDVPNGSNSYLRSACVL